MMAKKVLVVDAVSSGQWFVKSLNKMGVDVYHFRSYPHIQSNDPSINFVLNSYKNNINKSDYVKMLDKSDYKSFDEMISDIKKYNFDAIFAASEVGVIDAEKIASAVGVLTNDPHNAEKRRNKFLMQQALKENHINYIKHIRTDKKDDVYKFFDKNGKKAIIVKEISGGGTHNVYICRNKRDISDAVDTILNSYDEVLNKNTAVLAQELVKGTEFVVNSVSSNGKHKFISLLVHNKIVVNGVYPVYDITSVIESDQVNDSVKKIIEYNYKCLDALGILNGASHSEIMLQENGEPVLIETGARILGTCLNYPEYKETMGYYDYDIIIDSYIHPKRLEKIFKSDYKTYGSLMFKHIINYNDNQKYDYKKCVELLEKIPNVRTADVIWKSKTLDVTKSLTTSPINVVIFSKNRSSAKNTYNIIHKLETEFPNLLFTGVAKTDAEKEYLKLLNGLI
jgi:biotin carboxylase